MSNLNLNILLSAVDKITAPFKSAEKASKKLANAIKESKDSLKSLEKVQGQINGFQRLKANIDNSTKSIQKYNEKITSLQGKHEKLKSGRDNLIVSIKNKKRELQQIFDAQNALSKGGLGNSSEYVKLSTQAMFANQAINRLEQELQKQKNALTASKKAINAEKTALKTNRHEKALQLVELRKLRQKLKESGVNVKRLGTEELIAKNKINQATKEIDKQKKALEQLNKTKVAQQKYQQRVEMLKSGSERLANFGQRSMIMGAGLVGAGYATGKGVVSMAKTAAQFEQFQTVLETTEGSQSKAKQSMDWISDFATKTPYELGEVTESFVRLRAYGMDPTNGLLKTLGDTSSAMGKPIMQAVEAIADAVTGENERLKEFGIKGNAIKGTNVVEYEYTDKNGKQRTAKVNKNNRKQIEETLKRIWNEKYADAMEKQSKTLIGIWSNLQDQWVRFQNMIMQSGAFEVLKGKLKNILDTIDQMSQNGELAKWANDISQGISAVVEGMWGAIVIIAKSAKLIGQWVINNKDLAVSLIKWGSALGASLIVVGAFSNLLSFILYPLARIVLGIAKITGLNSSLATSLEKINIKAVLTNKALWSWKTTLSGLGSALSLLQNKIKNLPTIFSLITSKVKTISFWLNGLKRIVYLLLSPFKLLFSAVGLLFSPMGLLIAAISTGAILIYKNWEKVKAFFSGFIDGLMTGLAPVIEKFKPLGDLLGIVVDWIKKAFDAISNLLSPTQTTSQELDKAASAGKKFGEWLAAGIDLVTTPLQWVMNAIKWVSDNMPRVDESTKATQESMQKTLNRFHGGTDILMDTAGRDVLTPKATGGYTGSGGKYDPAGIVHRGEFVFNKAATDRLGVGFLSTLCNINIVYILT